MRHTLYRQLWDRVKEPDFRDPAIMEKVIRNMMWLEMSRRNEAKLNPKFENVIAFARKRAGEDEALKSALDSIMLERENIRASLRRDTSPSDPLDVKRRAVDQGVKNLLPATFREQSFDDKMFLSGRGYKKRLKSLEDRRVRELIDLNNYMVVILEKSNPNPDDFKRAKGLMDLVEYTLWTIRNDFDPEKYLAVKLDAKDGKWWPALSVLAAFNRDYRNKMEKWCQKLNKGTEQEKKQLLKKDAVLKTLFFQNEAIYWTVVAAAQKENAKEILGFTHKISVHDKNFIILADAFREVEASGKSLATDALLCAADNLNSIKNCFNPSDQLICDILFGNVHKGFLKTLGKKDHGALSLSRSVTEFSYSYKSLVNQAVQWKEKKMPEALNSAATKFLDLGNPSLITGAETTEGAMKAFSWAVKEKPSKDARMYYTRSLVTESKQNDRLKKCIGAAFAEPFFRNDFGGQKKSWENLLKGWRELHDETLQDPALKKDRLVLAFQSDFSRIAMDLFKGKGRPEGCTEYLMKPADDLKKEKGIRESAPQEYLQLCQWFFSLKKASDPPQIKALFSTGQTSEPRHEN